MFYLQKTQCPRWDSIPGPLALQTIALPTELKEISTNAVSRGCYEPTKVPITLSRGHSHYTLLKQHLYSDVPKVMQQTWQLHMN